MKDKKQEIQNLYKEFADIKNYNKKLKFFDEHFSLLPFHYPSFNEHLDFLLKPSSIDLLIELLEKERKKSFSYIKKISHDNEEYSFDINPHNSNTHFFNEFIITKFTCCDNYFNNLLKEIKKPIRTNKKSIEVNITEVKSLEEIIKQKIENKKDRTFRKQLFTVFYSGYIDYTNRQIKEYPQKKKLIELYLYSMGILFGKYKEALLEHQSQTDFPLLRAKVSLLNELGVTQFLRDKYIKSGEININNKIAEIFGTITGGNEGLVKQML